MILPTLVGMALDDGDTFRELEMCTHLCVCVCVRACAHAFIPLFGAP